MSYKLPCGYLGVFFWRNSTEIENNIIRIRGEIWKISLVENLRDLA
jgi:hypothetical protein